MSEITISITEPTKEFDNHIKTENNNRILFSGPFGIGKSTFLRQYFAKSDNYKIITLRPVNYAVASNEDIFKLIKYDILYQLLENNMIEVDDFGKFNQLEIVSSFVANGELELITPFIESVPEIGGTISNVLIGLANIRAKFKKFKKDVNTNQEIREIESFLAHNETNHYLFEDDFISQLIKGSVHRFNQTISDNVGGVVLIIDDLDRIDPEHIFRLFNIFSTHFEYSTEYDNKFGFHRVIFVCDVVNIRSIFQQKYGMKTDFNGYIDKFYSTKVFKYDNRSAITDFISQAIPKIRYATGVLSPADLKFITDLLCGMLELGVTNLRNLKKAVHINESRLNEIFDHSIIRSTDFGNLYFTQVAMALSYLVGDVNMLLNLLKGCRDHIKESKIKHFGFEGSEESKYLHLYFIPVLDYHIRGLNATESTSFVWPGCPNYTYVLSSSSHRVRAISQSPAHIIPKGICWDWLVNSVVVLKDYNVLK